MPVPMRGRQAARQPAIMGVTRLFMTGLFAAGILAAPLPACGAAPVDDRTTIALEALSRLKGIDLERNPAVKQAVLTVLDQVRGTSAFIEIVRDFQIKDQEPALLDFALRHPGDSTGAEAMRLVVAKKVELVNAALRSTNGVHAAEALGNTAENRVVPLLRPLLLEPANRDSLPLRKRVVQAMAKTQEGANALLGLAREEKLPPDLTLTTSVALNNSPWPAIKSEAALLLPLPRGQDARPLPPIAELIKEKGDAKRGEEVFRSPQVGCGSCHQVNGIGVDFGPKLSEIGTKLGKEALYESILDPSAGISFGFEAWQITLNNGDDALGLVVSETADSLSLKTQAGIVTNYPKAAIAKREQLKTSIMPAGLQQALSIRDFIDLIEYLAGLKKAE